MNTKTIIENKQMQVDCLTNVCHFCWNESVRVEGKQICENCKVEVGGWHEEI
jgi:hypothetical protein